MYVLSHCAIGDGILRTEMSPGEEIRDISSVGLIFPPDAAVGSPVMAVCDTLSGSTNPIEEVVIY